MILHELATNAAKYGALARGGRVDMNWHRDGPHVVVTWSEFCGTQVNKPEKTGFGMKLITRETVYTLGGHSDIEFAPDGLKVTLRFPGEEKGVGE
jgi:two-component sensor histidine kinase